MRRSKERVCADAILISRIGPSTARGKWTNRVETATRNCRDDTQRRKRANSTVSRIRNDNKSARVDGNADGAVKEGSCSHAIDVAAAAVTAIAEINIV